jgi:hypothetical protein
MRVKRGFLLWEKSIVYTHLKEDCLGPMKGAVNEKFTILINEELHPK